MATTNLEVDATIIALRQGPPGCYAASNPSYIGDPAREAYNDAVKAFNEKLTKDECKRIWLSDKIDIQQVQDAVTVARKSYESKSQQSKARKWLTKFSERIMYYSKIMDMLSQHHPEYVALAWGAMKFLVISVINHEELIAQISKAFSQIAAALPRANLEILLYPTEQIQLAVSTLYAYIIKFMQRAVKWYTEGKFKHMFTSVMRPYALRFEDLVQSIERCSENVDQLAVCAAQAEQRDMHILLVEIKRRIIENQAANSRFFLDSRRRTCEIQFSQILTFTATTALPSPEESFLYRQFLSARRRLRTNAEINACWRSPKIQEWASARTSSLILIKGSCLTRHETKDFAADIVGLLRKMNIPVVWTLSAKAEGNSGWRSPVDVLKQLVSQILHLNQALLNEQSVALNAVRFQSASTEIEWFELLSSVLPGLQQIYIVVDAEILSPEFSSQIAWPAAFLKLFEDLAARSCKTIIKVVLISFGATPYFSSPSPLEDVSIRIDRDRRRGSLAKRKSRFRSVAQRQGSEYLRPYLLRYNEGCTASSNAI